MLLPSGLSLRGFKDHLTSSSKPAPPTHTPPISRTPLQEPNPKWILLHPSGLLRFLQASPRTVLDSLGILMHETLSSSWGRVYMGALLPNQGVRTFCHAVTLCLGFPHSPCPFSEVVEISLRSDREPWPGRVDQCAPQARIRTPLSLTLLDPLLEQATAKV
jgi:hypothetical protein